MKEIDILNKSKQNIILTLKGGKNVEVLGNSTMTLTSEEFSSVQVQNLLKRGTFIVKRMEETTKKKWKPEVDESSGTDASGSGETIEKEESEPSEQTEKEPEEIHEIELKKTGYVRKKK
jgi:hypothetical protein